LLELENNEDKDENAITSLMDELLIITENIKDLERSEVTWNKILAKTTT